MIAAPETPRRSAGRLRASTEERVLRAGRPTADAPTPRTMIPAARHVQRADRYVDPVRPTCCPNMCWTSPRMIASADRGDDRDHRRDPGQVADRGGGADGSCTATSHLGQGPDTRTGHVDWVRSGAWKRPRACVRDDEIGRTAKTTAEMTSALTHPSRPGRTARRPRAYHHGSADLDDPLGEALADSSAMPSARTRCRRGRWTGRGHCRRRVPSEPRRSNLRYRCRADARPRARARPAGGRRGNLSAGEISTSVAAQIEW